MHKEVFLALGSNLGNPQKKVLEAFQKISKLSHVLNCQLSSLYLTTAVSDIAQDDYINAVCSLSTSYEVWQLKEELEKIEQALGKTSKPKNYPRMIDIDILLYGELYLHTEELQIPHVRMLERLFVLKPLSNLVSEIIYPISSDEKKKINLDIYLESFSNLHQEVVRKISSQ